MAQKIEVVLKGDALEVVLKGDALEDAREAFKTGREVRLEGNQSLLIEQEGGEMKYYSLGQYSITPERAVLHFGKQSLPKAPKTFRRYLAR